MDEFEVATLVLGGLLILGALTAGLAHRSFLSMTAVFVVAGFVLGEGGLEVLEFDAESGFVVQLATVALIVILFRDGIEVEAEMLQREWRLPARKLILAMPITCVLIALVTHAVTDLNWTESFLLGALLSPTDPGAVLERGARTRACRGSCATRSTSSPGMNDGLALPAVLAFSAALAAGEDDFVWYEFVLQDVTLGFAFGIGMGYLASWLMPRGAEDIPAHHKSLYALGVAFATYGVAVLEPLHGNGFIAVFVCAITLGIRRPDLGRHFEERADDIVEIVKLGIFVVFGALLTFGGLFEDGWAAVAHRRVHAPVRPHDRDLDLAGGHRDRHRHQGLHGLVRAQGRGDDDVLDPRPRSADRRGRAHLQPRGAGRLLLDHRPRAERHARVGVDRYSPR